MSSCEDCEGSGYVSHSFLPSEHKTYKVVPWGVLDRIADPNNRRYTYPCEDCDGCDPDEIRNCENCDGRGCHPKNCKECEIEFADYGGTVHVDGDDDDPHFCNDCAVVLCGECGGEGDIEEEECDLCGIACHCDEDYDRWKDDRDG